MTIEKNTTAEEISKMHAILLYNYVNGDGAIESISTIKDAAVEYLKVKIDDFQIMTTTSDSWTQIEMLELMEEIMASSYLAAIAELIMKKQEHEQKKYSSMLNTTNGNKFFGPSAGKSY